MRNGNLTKGNISAKEVLWKVHEMLHSCHSKQSIDDYIDSTGVIKT